MKTVIVTSFDNKYMPYANVMVNTFSNNYNGLDNIDFYCLVPKDIKDQQNEFIKSCGDISNLNLKFITADGFEDLNVKPDQWFSKNAWHRIFISSVCKNFDRAIYIDPDTIILRDVLPLINYPNYSPFIAYTQDEFSKYSLDNFGSPDLVYINDGVFIADVKYWRDNDIEGLLLEHIKKTKQTSFIEQDAFNLVMQKYISPLPVTFNFFIEKLELYDATPSPMIVHFNGNNKPWKIQSDNKYHLMWQEVHQSLTL